MVVQFLQEMIKKIQGNELVLAEAQAVLDHKVQAHRVQVLEKIKVLLDVLVTILIDLIGIKVVKKIAHTKNLEM